MIASIGAGAAYSISSRKGCRVMFVVLVYDVGENRAARALKTCRKYLNWVQNSVFEGEISDVNLKKLKAELTKVLDLSEDSVILYTWRTQKYSSREILGVEKGSIDLFL
jgi:CRISPR-associated protein Cas2